MYQQQVFNHFPLEREEYLSKQVITYLGNKRALLDFLGSGLKHVLTRLKKDKLTIFDAFSGSGITARYFKGFSESLYVNDLEPYAEIINQCYLSNKNSVDLTSLQAAYTSVCQKLETEPLIPGLISELYAPKSDEDIKEGERVFYTARNARYLDTARTYIEELPKEIRPFLLAPLLTEASIHANTSGVFKGFYKDSAKGLGKFGGNKGDALSRIKGDITLPFPVFSRFSCPVEVLRGDANKVIRHLPEVDLAYLDPPYNQHPYGSNYFMLNLLVEYKKPEKISKVSGIPCNWQRSSYNKRGEAVKAFTELVEGIKAKFLLVSFNSEGFISYDTMLTLLSRVGKVQTLETKYNTFRGSRNLREREIHVKEYLYLVEKR